MSPPSTSPGPSIASEAPISPTLTSPLNPTTTLRSPSSFSSASSFPPPTFSLLDLRRIVFPEKVFPEKAFPLPLRQLFHPRHTPTSSFPQILKKTRSHTLLLQPPHHSPSSQTPHCKPQDRKST